MSHHHHKLFSLTLRHSFQGRYLESLNSKLSIDGTPNFCLIIAAAMGKYDKNTNWGNNATNTWLRNIFLSHFQATQSLIAPNRQISSNATKQVFGYKVFDYKVFDYKAGSCNSLIFDPRKMDQLEPI